MSDNLRTLLDADWLRSRLGKCHIGSNGLKSQPFPRLDRGNDEKSVRF
jgi:hypothetical protein